MSKQLCAPAEVVEAVHDMRLLMGRHDVWRVVMMLQLVSAARRGGVRARQQADRMAALAGLHVPHGLAAQLQVPHSCHEDLPVGVGA